MQIEIHPKILRWILPMLKTPYYVSYTFVLNNGNLIDGSDSADYAGYFFKKDIKNNEIKLKIRDYINNYPAVGDTSNLSLVYDLNIRFLSDSSFRWYIDTNKYGPLPRLPDNLIFKVDESK